MAYIYNMADTWADAGTTFTAIKMNVLDTASNAASLLMDLQVGGTSRLSVRKDGRINGAAANTFVNSNGGFWSFYSSNIFVGQITSVNAIGGNSTGFHAQSLGLVTSEGVVPDIILARDAANILAQRNSTNAQTFRVYNTFTDASNFERLGISFASNIARIETEQLGTGTSRILLLRGNQLFLRTGSSGNGIGWQIDGGGNFMAATDNTHDIGASGATRPRDVYIGGTYRAGTASFGQTSILFSDWAASFGYTSGSAYTHDGNRNLILQLSASGGQMVKIGGTTSSFPALKRNGAMLETRLADDSGFAAHGAEWLSVTDGVTAPGAAAGRARIYVDTADGDLKVVFADGTVKTIVTDT